MRGMIFESMRRTALEDDLFNSNLAAEDTERSHQRREHRGEASSAAADRLHRPEYQRTDSKLLWLYSEGEYTAAAVQDQRAPPWSSPPGDPAV